MIEPIEELAPGLRRLLAPNPGPMTYRGTNTYLLGTHDLAVIDPGPDVPGHLDAILGALAPGQSIAAILVTHSHRDHSELVPALKRVTGAPVHAFGPSEAGRSPLMERLAREGSLSGGEGIDPGFTPDILLPDAARISGSDWTLTAHWTPGHMANHMCFEWHERGALFTGDLVMGWASSLISPPDGDIGQFLRSLDRIDRLGPEVLFSGHGDPISDPATRVAWLRTHRHARMDLALSVLSESPQGLEALMPRVYADVPEEMWGIAARNLLASLIELEAQGKVRSHPAPGLDAQFKRL